MKLMPNSVGKSKYPVCTGMRKTFLSLFCSRYLLSAAVFLPAFLFCLTACRNRAQEKGVLPSEPDYRNSESWFIHPKDAAADVFYIVPTCTWDWRDSSGRLQHHADIYNNSHRNAMLGNMRLADTIFGSQANFYSPFYRQITIENWMCGDSMVNANFPVALQDIKKAFRHYMQHFNNGKPFILAGFSQGGKAVAELLKTLEPQERSRMVAAYVIGYRILPEEYEQHACRIVPAQDSTDLGVVVSYNSAASYASIPDVIKPIAFCINPLNWRTDAVPVLLPDGLSVRLDTVFHFLQIDGLSLSCGQIPGTENLFPAGCYHLLELNFYREALSHNVSRRTYHFLQQNR